MGPALTSHPETLPPGFEFRRVLGTGSTGWVALARQTALDRDVAVKTVLIGDAAGPAVRRLEREARVLAGLDHPGIARIYRLIPGRTAVFLVMEHVPGGSLAEHLAIGSLPPARSLSLLTEVAVALAVVHARGIVHRDLKPANMIVHPQRGAVLLDFGLARLPAPRAAFRTAAGTPTGTPLYMAPEQLTEPDAATPAIDAYAFGILAYQLLLGEYPYQATTVAEVMQAHRSGRPADPRSVAARLSRGAAGALLAALDKDPGRRPTPSELAATLRKVPLDSWAVLAASPAPVAAPASSSDSGTTHAPLQVSGSVATQAPTAPGAVETQTPLAATGVTAPPTGSPETGTGTQAADPTRDSDATAGPGAADNPLADRPTGVAVDPAEDADDRVRSVAAPAAPAGPAAPADTPVTAVTSVTSVDDPGSGWVSPAVYRPGRSRGRGGRRRREHRHSHALLIVGACVLGLLIGLAFTAIWLRA